MSVRNDGGPAFPSSAEFIDPQNRGWIGGGMTLRDYSAVAVLAAMAQSAGFQGAPWEKLAVDAYEAADALLAARTRHGANDG